MENPTYNGVVVPLAPHLLNFFPGAEVLFSGTPPGSDKPARGAFKVRDVPQHVYASREQFNADLEDDLSVIHGQLEKLSQDPPVYVFRYTRERTGQRVTATFDRVEPVDPEKGSGARSEPLPLREDETSVKSDDDTSRIAPSDAEPRSQGHVKPEPQPGMDGSF